MTVEPEERDEELVEELRRAAARARPRRADFERLDLDLLQAVKEAADRASEERSDA